jgi:hypothetical protein
MSLEATMHLRSAAYVLAALLCGTGVVAAETACKGLGKVDPSDLLRVEKTQVNLPFLANGTGCYGEHSAAQCDWHTVITGDRMMNASRRLIVATSNHDGGSGAWDNVLIFDCATGNPRVVFQERYLYGVRIEKASPAALVLVGGHWKPSDPNCCNSAERRTTFRWDKTHHRYVIDGSDLVPKPSALQPTPRPLRPAISRVQ